MNEPLLYTLAAASVGFVAAIFFGFGTALLRRKAIVLLASTYWDYNEEQAAAIVSQSAQYLTGGVLLVASFALQVLASLASPTTLVLLHPCFVNGYVVVLTVLLLAGLSGWLLYCLVLRWRLPQVLNELKERGKP